MSYDDNYGGGQSGHGSSEYDDRRGYHDRRDVEESEGPRRGHGGDDYGDGRRHERGYEGGRLRDDGYDGHGRQEHHGRDQRGYGGNRDVDDYEQGRQEYGRRGESGYEGGRGEEDYRRRHEGYDGAERSRHGEDRGGDNYQQRRQAVDPAEYGGGGRGNDNYYNSQASYGDEPSRGHAGYGSRHGEDDDFQGALSHAKQNSSDEPDLFSAALGYLSGNKQQIADEDDIDESQAINSYKATYGGEGRGQQHGSETLGAGAAIEALKMFTGEGAGQGGMGSQGAGNSQSQLIGMAMAQAATLFDKQSSEGNVVSFYATLTCCSCFITLTFLEFQKEWVKMSLR